MRITRIENQKKRPGRKNIYVDGEFVAGVSAETLLRLAIRTGDEIGPDQIRVLKQTEELLSAKNVALRFLSIRPRTVREVRDKLREREFADPEIIKVTGELTQAGLLDDLEFARIYIRNAIAIRPSGNLLLRKKLLLLGVDKQTVERALQDTLGKENEEEAALRQARKFVSSARSRRKDEDAAALRRRLAAFLSRRGYSWEIVSEAMKKSLGGSTDE